MSTRWHLTQAWLVHRVPRCNASTARLQRLRPNGTERRRSRDGFGIDQAVQNGRFAACHGALEGRAEGLGGLDTFAMATKGLGVGSEVGIGELRGEDTPRILAFLVHADRAIHGIV